jgi:hypothetical protein
MVLIGWWDVRAKGVVAARVEAEGQLWQSGDAIVTIR